MKSHCSYHPTRPALHYCPKCDTDYCPDCVTRREMRVYGAKKEFYFCPKCGGEAESLGVSNFIPPFWNRLPRFFTYPLHPRPLILMILLAAAGTFLTWVPFLSTILWGVLIKYSYASLRSTMHGNLQPPEASHEVIVENFGQVFKQIMLFAVIGVGVVFAFIKGGPAAGISSLLFVVLFLPAMLIVLVISDSLIAALNPVSFVTLARRIGWGYLLMYLFLVLLGIAPLALAQTFTSAMPETLQRFLFILANQYYTIIAYNLMGYVILQYHEEVGYEVPIEDFRDQAPVLKGGSSSARGEDKSMVHPLLGRLDILIKDGKLDDAIFLIQHEMGELITDRSLSGRYYTLLKLTNRIPEMLSHATAHLKHLVEGGEKGESCTVYIECISHDPQFEPAPEDLFEVSGWLAEQGNIKEAAAALVKFIKNNPDHPLEPKAHFLLGKMFQENLRDSAKANKVFTRLIQKYPNHEITAFASRYLEELKRAASTTTAAS